jgi:hypothetical protein
LRCKAYLPPATKPRQLHNCDVCQKAKQTRHTYHRTKSQATCPLHLIHLDAMGPMRVEGYLREKYVVTLSLETNSLGMHINRNRQSFTMHNSVNLQTLGRKLGSFKLHKLAVHMASTDMHQGATGKRWELWIERSCHVTKVTVYGRLMPFPEMLYFSDILVGRGTAKRKPRHLVPYQRGVQLQRSSLLFRRGNAIPRSMLSTHLMHTSQQGCYCLVRGYVFWRVSCVT